MTDHSSDVRRSIRFGAPCFFWQSLHANLEGERDRWVLWVPVGFGCGIAIYFDLPVEPWPGLGLASALVLLASSALARHRGGRRWHFLFGLTIPLALVAAGFAAAQLETARDAAPRVPASWAPRGFVGRVVDIESRDGGPRVTLIPEIIGDLPGNALPSLIRLRFRDPPDGLAVGDRVSGEAVISPPPPPAMPGGFDFQRMAYFERLGGVGFALGPVTATHLPSAGWRGRLSALRLSVAARVEECLPGTEGAIAAAMITGERGAIPAATNQDFRDAGLAHLLVIAGLHMSLVTGFAFFMVRAFLAAIPPVALRYPIKKWAAAAAMVVALGYLGLSGAAVPTQRAFVMSILVLIAILTDRLQLSILGLAWAALIVLVLDPAALVGVSFQMSFAAVLALIAFHEVWSGASWIVSDGGLVRRVAARLFGILVTTVIVSVATAPFALFHFNRVALFAVIANLVAVPIAAFWIMPCAVMACLLMPFGGEAAALLPMGLGLRVVVALAHWTAHLPDAALDVRATPGWGLGLAAAGGLWLCLWRRPWRRWGVLPLAAGLLAGLLFRSPDILIAPDGRLLALRTAPGRYALSSSRVERDVAGEWLRSAGGAVADGFPDGRGHVFTVDDGEKPAGTLRCFGARCIWSLRNQRIVVIRREDAFDEPCPPADIVIALVSLDGRCHGTRLSLDKDDAYRHGALAVWLGNSITIAASDEKRGDRPWVTGSTTAFVNSAAATRQDDPVP